MSSEFRVKRGELFTSQQVSFEQYFADPDFTERIIHVLVGDVQRLSVYAEHSYKNHRELFNDHDWQHICAVDGYQIDTEIPDLVWHAYSELVSLGYDKRLIQIYC